jgi:hypothetical protein
MKLALHKVVQAEDVAEKTRIGSLAHYIALHLAISRFPAWGIRRGMLLAMAFSCRTHNLTTKYIKFITHNLGYIDVET